jgi:hypothetical protein
VDKQILKNVALFVGIQGGEQPIVYPPAAAMHDGITLTCGISACHGPILTRQYVTPFVGATAVMQV